jgi:hypothetical protein
VLQEFRQRCEAGTRTEGRERRLIVFDVVGRVGGQLADIVDAADVARSDAGRGPQPAVERIFQPTSTISKNRWFCSSRISPADQR